MTATYKRIRNVLVVIELTTTANDQQLKRAYRMTEYVSDIAHRVHVVNPKQMVPAEYYKVMQKREENSL